MSAGQSRYINPTWLEYATDEELTGLEGWLSKTKPPRTQSGRQIYCVVEALIAGEVERRWERQPAKTAKKKNRASDTNTGTAKNTSNSRTSKRTN